jgi:hypothetical protein
MWPALFTISIQVAGPSHASNLSPRLLCAETRPSSLRVKVCVDANDKTVGQWNNSRPVQLALPSGTPPAGGWPVMLQLMASASAIHAYTCMLAIGAMCVCRAMTTHCRINSAHIPHVAVRAAIVHHTTTLLCGSHALTRSISFFRAHTHSFVFKNMRALQHTTLWGPSRSSRLLASTQHRHAESLHLPAWRVSRGLTRWPHRAAVDQVGGRRTTTPHMKCANVACTVIRLLIHTAQ